MKRSSVKQKDLFNDDEMGANDDIANLLAEYCIKLFNFKMLHPPTARVDIIYLIDFKALILLRTKKFWNIIVCTQMK